MIQFVFLITLCTIIALNSSWIIFDWAIFHLMIDSGAMRTSVDFRFAAGFCVTKGGRVF